MKEEEIEPKTIEDLNEEFRKDNIPQRLSGDEFNDYWEERLRKEAIKWVKWLDDNLSFSGATRDFWMERFDIKEEDLK